MFQCRIKSNCRKQESRCHFGTQAKEGQTCDYSSVFTIHFVFVQREDLLFQFAYFVCRFIYIFIQFIFVFYYYYLFHTTVIYYFLPLATSFYDVPAEVADQKVTVLVVDCCDQPFLLKLLPACLIFGKIET